MESFKDRFNSNELESVSLLKIEEDAKINKALLLRLSAAKSKPAKSPSKIAKRQEAENEEGEESDSSQALDRDEEKKNRTSGRRSQESEIFPSNSEQ